MFLWAVMFSNLISKNMTHSQSIGILSIYIFEKGLYEPFNHYQIFNHQGVTFTNFIQVENGDQTACFIQDFLAIISGIMDIL